MSGLTAPALRSHKVAGGAKPLVMLTAYDEPSARLADAAGVDLLLVGDSLSNVVLGHEDTLQVTVEQMAHHTAAVARARPSALIVGDLPWMSYHVSTAETVRNAATLVRAGAGCVKLEGGRNRLEAVAAIIDAEVPVMGHLGLTPQSVHAMGGYRVQGKTVDAAQELLDDARALAEAGCSAIVLEGIPADLAAKVTADLPVPTIGIGAGAACDGQVLVFHDLLGLSGRQPPRFVRAYAELGRLATEAIAAFAADVRSGAFPSEAETYGGPEGLGDAIS